MWRWRTRSKPSRTAAGYRLNSRVLHKAITVASETYNTALEAHLGAALGVRFEARPQQDPRKRPVREVVGVNPALLERCRGWVTSRPMAGALSARATSLPAEPQREERGPTCRVLSFASWLSMWY